METRDRQAAEPTSENERVLRRTASGGARPLDDAGRRGERGTDAATDHPEPNRVVLEALTDDAAVRIEVGGEIAKGRFADDVDEVRDGGVAVARFDERGALGSFRFSGTTVTFEILNGDVETTLDLRTDGPVEPDGPTRLGIHAQGSDVAYRFGVSGDIEPVSDTADACVTEGDGTVTGTVTGSGVDSYVYVGEMTEFETSTDDVIVMLDDAVAAPGDLG